MAPGAETRVRQLIANGKYKLAVESAKDLHRAHASPASEALLVDAYAARIQALMQQNLNVEAKALLELVRQRHPASSARLDGLTATASMRAGSLEDLVQPLADPALHAGRRAAIECTIRKEVWDLAALAACPALPTDHPLRQAAAALDRAFTAVTAGPVEGDVINLPEISRRSPLASWKVLIRAIASFYRHDDQACLQFLNAVEPDSAPAKLVPAFQAMLDPSIETNPGDRKTGLSAAAATLIARTTGGPVAFRKSLEALDQAFESDFEESLLKAIRIAVRECRQSSPALLDRLRSHISARCVADNIKGGSVTSALGGNPPADAYSWRVLARALELTREPVNVAIALGIWDRFRLQAVAEGWFPPNGPEVATLYLHMAKILAELPDNYIRARQNSARTHGVPGFEGDVYFFYPEKLYERACGLDPHAEAFSQWMTWAERQPGAKAEPVAEAWRKSCPRDIAPILRLMQGAEKRNSLQKALQLLAAAELLDSVNPVVRGARLRLLASSVLRHIQQRKHALAEQKLDQLAALPQAQQGDRPAYLAALRTVAAGLGDDRQMESRRQETARLLESEVAANLLCAPIAAAAKRPQWDFLGPLDRLLHAQRTELPAALARVAALVKDMQVALNLPPAVVREAGKQFSKVRHTFDAAQLRTLAEAALEAREYEFAYAVSAAGLDLARSGEAGFLLLRSLSLEFRNSPRAVVCAAAAAQLARAAREMEVVDAALESLRERFKTHGPEVTAKQAADVLRKEKEARNFPAAGGGPNYERMFPPQLCQCPDCRAARGEIDAPEDFDFGLDFDDDDDPFANLELPPGMPPEIGRILLDEFREAFLRGESPEEFVARKTGINPRAKRRKKRR